VFKGGVFRPFVPVVTVVRVAHSFDVLSIVAFLVRCNKSAIRFSFCCNILVTRASSERRLRRLSAHDL
jgi:hypothetical protein